MLAPKKKEPGLHNVNSPVTKGERKEYIKLKGCCLHPSMDKFFISAANDLNLTRRLPVD